MLAQGCLLLVAIQLPGALFDYAIRRDIGPPVVFTGGVLLVAVLALFVYRGTTGAWFGRMRPVGAIAVAAALVALCAQLAPVIMHQAFVEAAPSGMLVPAPGRRLRDCRGRPTRCHEHVLNELGFRGELARRAAPDVKLVAFIGDSFIFGSGVGDADTVPAVVARNLSDLNPPVAVLNAGIEGLAGVSFPGVIAYVRAQLHPDVVVVLFKNDDLDDADMLSRWDRFRRSFWFRVLYVLNVEPISETARQVWRHWGAPGDTGAVLARELDAIYTAAADAKLLLVVDLVDQLRPVFSDWLAAHPDVAAMASWEQPRYWQAEKIPGDGHWNEAGCTEIAAILTPALRTQLAYASRDRDGGP